MGRTEQRDEGGGKTHMCRTARAVNRKVIAAQDDLVVERLQGDVGDATTIRTEQIT